MTDVHALDDSVYDAVARTSTPALDGPVTWISNAANYGKLWVAIAAVLALTGGARGQRAAVRALMALGVTSITANLVVKQVVPRRRPERSTVNPARAARMPASSSFPSGHTASAFAFATAVTADFPLLSALLFGLATVVGYSRVHTGVHFPTDVIAGGILGCSLGTVVCDATLRVGPLSLSGRLTDGNDSSCSAAQSRLLKVFKLRWTSRLSWHVTYSDVTGDLFGCKKSPCEQVETAARGCVVAR
jgi:undecaprenyl-diphosphatase